MSNSIQRYPYINNSKELEFHFYTSVKILNTDDIREQYKYINTSSFFDANFYVKVIQVSEEDSYKYYYFKCSNVLQRLNSNQYIDSETDNVFEIDDKYFEDLSNTNKITVYKKNHGFSKYNILTFVNGNYTLAKSDSKDTSIIYGIVSNVINNDAFELLSAGELELSQELSQMLKNKKSSVLYLSNKVAGKITLFEDITGNIFVPIGFYNKNKIIIRLDNGIITNNNFGIVPYNTEEQTNIPAKFNEIEISNIIAEVYNNDRE